jgi:serine protease Do
MPLALISTTDVATSLTEIASQVRRSTVQISGRGTGGSGVIWDSNGLIITNAHVIHSSQQQVELWDGRKFAATILDRNTELDLAALKIEAIDLPVAKIGNSADLRVGELVLALGYPFGIEGALTVGIIHTLNQHESPYRDLIQSDIRLAPGNSGGPLANANGEIIGINSMIAGNLGVAVSSLEVTRFLKRSVEREPLGVTLQPVVLQEHVGLVVVGIEEDKAAMKAGMIVGDILIGVAGQRFNEYRALLHAIRYTKADMLELNILRGGQPVTVKLSLQVKQEAA